MSYNFQLWLLGVGIVAVTGLALLGSPAAFWNQ